MDMRKYSASVIRPEDLHDGPREETIIKVSENSKHNCAVLEFESGDQLYLWNSLARALYKAWGYDSENYLGQKVELSLSSYLDKRTDPPAEKECIAIRAVSSPKATGNGGAPAKIAPHKGDRGDKIPF